jgi:hypothetical protein
LRPSRRHHTFVTQLAPAADQVTALLLIPATAGKFWMIGWLLWHSFRTRSVTG